MTTLSPRRGDIRYADRKSATNCVIARAGRRTWGGTWVAGLGGASQQIGGTTRLWELRARDKARMALYDAGGPWLPGKVKLIRKSPGRTLKRAAVPAGAGAAWLAVSAGFGSLILVLVYTAVAVAGYLVLGAFGKVSSPAPRVSETDAARRPLYRQQREAQAPVPESPDRGAKALAQARELMARGVESRPVHSWPAPGSRPGGKALTSPDQIEVPDGLRVPPDMPSSARAQVPVA